MNVSITNADLTLHGHMEVLYTLSFRSVGTPFVTAELPSLSSYTVFSCFLCQHEQTSRVVYDLRHLNAHTILA